MIGFEKGLLLFVLIITLSRVPGQHIRHPFVRLSDPPRREKDLTSLKQSNASVIPRRRHPSILRHTKKVANDCGEKFSIPGELLVNGLWCTKCPPGRKRQFPCDKSVYHGHGDNVTKKQRRCVKCDPGTYNKCYGVATYCAKCSEHCPGEGQEIFTKKGHCPSKGAYRDIKCFCKDPSYFLKESFGECWKQSPCSRGTKVYRNGTKWSKTKCKRCGEGMYQDKTGFDVKCKKITDCKSQGKQLLKPGNRRRNAVCSAYKSDDGTNRTKSTNTLHAQKELTKEIIGSTDSTDNDMERVTSGSNNHSKPTESTAENSTPTIRSQTTEMPSGEVISGRKGHYSEEKDHWTTLKPPIQATTTSMKPGLAKPSDTSIVKVPVPYIGGLVDILLKFVLSVVAVLIVLAILVAVVFLVKKLHVCKRKHQTMSCGNHSPRNLFGMVASNLNVNVGKRFLRELGGKSLSDQSIDSLFKQNQCQNQNMYDFYYEGLMQWYKQNPNCAVLQEIVLALEKIDERQLAQQIQES